VQWCGVPLEVTAFGASPWSELSITQVTFPPLHQRFCNFYCDNNWMLKQHPIFFNNLPHSRLCSVTPDNRINSPNHLSSATFTFPSTKSSISIRLFGILAIYLLYHLVVIEPFPPKISPDAHSSSKSQSNRRNHNSNLQQTPVTSSAHSHPHLIPHYLLVPISIAISAPLVMEKNRDWMEFGQHNAHGLNRVWAEPDTGSVV
jgi:hypothetical protein